MNTVFGGILIQAIKLILTVLALGMLIAAGAASGDGAFDGRNNGHGNDHDFGGHDNHNFGDFNKYYDWLNPGGIYSYSYSWYPTYSYWNYPTYTYPVYTYPAYTYTTPVVTPVVYNTYAYDPVIYDPWYAANVYGFGGATYYYSSSWSWSSHRGGFFL